MQKTWAALHRRSETDVPLPLCYDIVFSALEDRNLGTGISIPETVVFGHKELKHFYFDTATATVMSTPAPLTTTTAVVDSFVNDTSVAPSSIYGSGDEQSRIVAVWLSEKKDAKGVVVGAEYFTSSMLAQFFRSGERRKLGVLQRFVYPRPRKGSQHVNQELIAHWGGGNGGPRGVAGHLQVQRLFASATNRIDAPEVHPTLRAIVHNPVLVAGKVAALTLPIDRSDITSGPHSETIEAPTFEQHVGGLCGRIQSFIETSLQETQQVHQTFTPAVRTFVAQLKFSRDDDQLYFCGLLSMRLSYGSSFELVRVPFPTADKPKVESGGNEFDVMPLAHNAYQTYVPAPARMPGGAYRSPTRGGGSGSDDEGSDMDDIANQSKYIHPRIPTGHFECPNCGIISTKEEMPLVSYKTIVDHTNRSNAASKRELETIIPRAKQDTWVYRPSSAKPKKQRPQSARVATSLEAAKAVSEDAACFKLGHEWVDLPPVLKKLRMPLDSVASRAVWMKKDIALCEGCANFFSSSSKDLSPPRRQKDADAEEHPSAAVSTKAKKPTPPSFLQSDVIDLMVTTDLQKVHRKMRRSERTKYEMREVINDAKSGVGEAAKLDREEREIDTLIQSITGPSPSTTLLPTLQQAGSGAVEDVEDETTTSSSKEPVIGIGVDTPPWLVKCNELYATMSKAVNNPRDLVLRPTSKPNRNYMAPLPKPAFLIDVEMTTKETLEALRVTSEKTQDGRVAAWKALSKNSLTFSDFNDAERELLVNVVGEDTARAVDDEDDYDTAGDL